MKKTTLNSSVIALALSLGALSSQADQLLTSASVSPQLLNSPGTAQALPTLDVPQFDTGLGVLNSITLSLTPNLSGSGVQIINASNPLGTQVTAGYTTANGYYGSVSVSAIPGLSGSWLTGPYTEQFTINTAPTFTTGTYALQNLPAPGAGSPVIVGGADMSPFEGTGTYSLADSATASWTVTLTAAPSSAYVGADCMAGATLNVTYDYTPVPEPSAMLLAGFGGLAGLLLRRRARR